MIIIDYFIEWVDILSGHLCDILMVYWTVDFPPEEWTEGVIIPLHKKGDESDVKHYRGTTVVSCMSKLCTAVLNKRIAAFCDLNNTI